MSVSFQGPEPTNTLDLSNGTASRLLKAIGFPVSEESSGALPLEQALEGIQKAKGTLDRPEDEELLQELESLSQGLQKAGATQLTWS